MRRLSSATFRMKLRRALTHPGIPVAVGAGLLAAGILLLVNEGLSDDAQASEPDHRVRVVVAADDLEPGDLGESLLVSGRVRLEPWSEDVPVGALTATEQLVDTVIASQVPAGTPLSLSHLRAETAREAAAVLVPEGYEGVSLTVPFTAGGAGYVGAGDIVNLYSVLDREDEVELILVASEVRVLDVSQEVAPYVAAGPRPDGASLTFLLALDPETAESVLLFGRRGSFYVTLLDADAPDREDLFHTLAERLERFKGVVAIDDVEATGEVE
jgi:Flp pilus assembly protein CpaB